jgi:formate-dependent nitrite reductase membrane component NrfD
LKPEQRGSPPARVPIADADLEAATRRQVRRVRRLKLNVTAWGLGTILLTAAWIAHEWQANGAFARLAHEGNAGDWNPTLWALVVLVWGLVVGSMAIRVHFERPPTAAAVDREADRLQRTIEEAGPVDAALRRLARARLERMSRLKSNVAVWLLALIALTPVNVLIEWQDNGAFERISRDSQPGSWDPWILLVGGIWAGVIVCFLALPVYLDRRKAKQ